MRLGAFVPSVLPADLALSLESCGIRTEIDFLFSNRTVDIFRRLPPGTVSLQELTNYVALVAEKASAPSIRGDHWLHGETRNFDDLSTGVPDLDRLLGGFGGTRVIEISGDRGSGKTVGMRSIIIYTSKIDGSSAFTCIRTSPSM
jgi:RAD51-like protein 3